MKSADWVGKDDRKISLLAEGTVPFAVDIPYFLDASLSKGIPVLSLRQESPFLLCGLQGVGRFLFSLLWQEG